jgi:starch synthase (maltosyl-transferring)
MPIFPVTMEDPTDTAATGQGNEEPEGRRRIWIEDVRPQVDGGRFDVKRTLGDLVEVSCDLVADGQDQLAGELRFRFQDGPWQSRPLERATSGLWRASFEAEALGRYEIRVEAWVDSYATWRAKLEKKRAAGQDLALELLVGAQLMSATAERATAETQQTLHAAATSLAKRDAPPPERWKILTPTLDALVSAHADRSRSTTSALFGIAVDPVLARFSSWYELFPRSAGTGGKHGTLKDVEGQLEELQAMGFDVLYLPPIHPIGITARKGKNNLEHAAPGDPGSPWAIGAAEGGHCAVHPELGTLADLQHLVAEARRRGISIALDIAFQASPDHPWVKEHPSWFVQRPDGTIQYAENPPKQYQDIYPFNFESPDWRQLWAALRDVFFFWIDAGVRVFRVDNPHTKPLPFWRWCLAEVKRRCPEAIFLAEAFTRPGLMNALAKAGFSQSYTYFTWRHTRDELATYLLELTRPPLSDFLRPNFWPTTPDILPEYLQRAGRAAFASRLILASTMSSNYGIYGPVFELQENIPRPGSEEYDHSEKYEVRSFERGRSDSLRDLMTRLNRIRHAHPALQSNDGVTIHGSSPQLLAFSKRDARSSDAVLTVVHLDPSAPRSGQLSLDLDALGIDPKTPFLAHDELSDQRYVWTGPEQTLALDPQVLPGAILHIRAHRRSERDFDYYT